MLLGNHGPAVGAEFSTQGLIAGQPSECIAPLAARLGQVAVPARNHEFRVRADGRRDDRQPRRHVLEELEAGLVAGTFVVGKRHDPDVEAAEDIRLEFQPPRNEAVGKGVSQAGVVTRHRYELAFEVTADLA